jgi:hypothetical protein
MGLVAEGIVVSGLLTVVSLPTAALSWKPAFTLKILLREEGLVVSSRGRAHTQWTWADVVEVDVRPFTPHLLLRRGDGTHVKISLLLVGISELASGLQRHVPRARITVPAWEKLTGLSQRAALQAQPPTPRA